jgi:hypothetical protein
VSFSSLARNLLATAAGRAPARSRARLQVESLEGRALLSASALGEAVHHHRHGMHHAEVRHRQAEVQVEHGQEVQAGDDRGGR